MFSVPCFTFLITQQFLFHLYKVVQLQRPASQPDTCIILHFLLTLKVLNFWNFTSYCSLKPLWSGLGEVVPAHTSPTLHPPSPPTVHQLSQQIKPLMCVLGSLKLHHCQQFTADFTDSITQICRRALSCSLKKWTTASVEQENGRCERRRAGNRSKQSEFTVKTIRSLLIYNIE